jgi:hypothetical protein
MNKKKGKDMRKSKITPDMSIYEASAFWDEHDFSEFDDVQETKEVKFHLRRYFELGCEVKGLGRGHVKRIKDATSANR